MSKALLNAQHYQQNSSFQEKCASEVLAQHQFSPTDLVLDIGCGDGKITAELANNVKHGRILGIDSSKEMINLAKKTFSNASSNLSFKQANAESDHGDKVYTVITSFSCLHWVRDIQTTLASIYKALKPGGYFLAVTYLKESPYYQPFIQALDLHQWRDDAKYSIFQHMLDGHYLIQSLKALGFNDINTQHIESSVEYENEEQYIQYVKGWLPCVLQLPQTKLDHYLDDVVLIAKQLFSKNTLLSIPYKKLHIYVKKTG